MKTECLRSIFFSKDFQDFGLLLLDFVNFGSQDVDGDERFVIAFSAGVTCSRLDILSDNNDRQQDQLQKGLRNPTDDHKRVMALNRGGQRDERQQGEGIRAPHGTDRFGNFYGNTRIEKTDIALTMYMLMHMVG